MTYSRAMLRMNLIFSAAFLCVACVAQGGSFERHSLSRLSEVPGSGVEFVYETREVPGYERDDPAAEAIRMRWLSGWLEVRAACNAGYEITERRPFNPREYNPHQSEFRYAVRCRKSPHNQTLE